MRVVRFESIPHLAKRCESMPEKWQGTNLHDTQGMRYQAAITKALDGDLEQIKDAERMLDQINSLSTTVNVPQWVNGMAGMFPDVPAYLAEEPECMRYRRVEEDTATPIGIWVDLTSSGGISHGVLVKRGMAILALAMKLEQLRPIEVNLMVGSPSNGVCVVVPVDSKPLNLAVTCFGMCHSAFARLLMYSVVRVESNNLVGSLTREESEWRRYLDIPKHDVVIASAYLSNEDAIVADPVGWVNAQLAKLGELG